MTCTFFGHRYVPQKIEPTLRSTLIDLIEHHEVDLFYVGNHGDFDAMVRRVLRELSAKYPIRYHVVLAYMPEKQDEYRLTDYSDTILPEGIETVIKRFAINYRNKWMIEQSDFVVTYVVHDSGSRAAQFKKLAGRKGKTIINLYIK
ncbi:MAG: hypothetical protein IJK58_09085 [Clostridia bacterium]|nr:hypothetical protein [Clostridia bacterium]